MYEKIKYQRIYIIGISGSGKSTLAKQLSSLLCIPSFDLDSISWIKKYTDRRNDASSEEELKKLLKINKSWIIEGVYEWGKIASDKADLVIFLNYGINIAIYRVIKRWINRKGEDKESIKDLYGLIQYIRSYKKVRPNRLYTTYEKHQKVILGNEHNLVEIKNKKQLKELLNELNKNK